MVAAWCAFAGLVFAIVNSIFIVHQRRAEARAFLARVTSDGTKTPARVTHSTAGWAYGELAFPVQVYEFEFTDRNGVVRQNTFREVESSPFDGGLYFSSQALRKLLNREELGSKRKTFDVEVLYLEADAKHLTLADPRMQAVQSGFPIFEVFWTGFGPVLIVIILFVYGLYRICCLIADAIVPRPR